MNLDFFTSTYKEYIVKWYNVNPVYADGNTLYCTFTTDSNGSAANYNQSFITNTMFQADHNEANDSPTLAYNTARDLARVKSSFALCEAIGNHADECGSGEIHVINPASTTYAKIVWGRGISYNGTDHAATDHLFAGYVGETDSGIDNINGMNFAMWDGGNLDGKFKLWGVK